MTEQDILERMAQDALEEQVAADRRIGKHWPNYSCFFCGHHSNDLRTCDCPHPESFRCAKLKSVCPGCREAHKSVAAHLERMFAERVARRADSRRSAAYRHLRGALEAIGERLADSQATRLRTQLGRHADPFDDDASRFRAAVLDAFRTSKFFDFRTLARELPEQYKIADTERRAVQEYFRRLRF
jgi:hypothetical protein